MPVIQIANDDFMDQEDQDDMPEAISLPIVDDLIFMKYTDGGECEAPGSQYFTNEIIHGFVFYYASLNMTRILEIQIQSEKDLVYLQCFQEQISTVLYILNERQKVVESKSEKISQLQKEVIREYCLETTQASLLSYGNINEIFLEDLDMKKGDKKKCMKETV